MSQSEIIKIVKNFMSTEDMKLWTDFCDKAVESRPDEMAIYADGLRYIFQFGKDKCETHYASNTNLDAISDLEVQARKIFSSVIEKTQELFNDQSKMYITGFWISKQLPGAYVGEHEDTDEGINDHFKYSAVLYLNTLETTGQLVFTDLNVKIKPEAGDLVVFESMVGGKHKVDKINENRYTLAFWMTESEEFAI